MAKLVLGMGTSHSPQLSIPADMWGAYGERDKINPDLHDTTGVHVTYDELLAHADPATQKQLTPEKFAARHQACQDGIAQLSAVYKQVKPDVLIIVGDDQEELFHDDLMPALLVYWGEEILSKPRQFTDNAPPVMRLSGWAYGESEQMYPVVSALGKHLIESMIDQGIDTAHSRRLKPGQGMGHAFGFVYRRIMDGTIVPTVPVMLNTYYPPNQPTPKRCVELGKAIRTAVESFDGGLCVGIIGSGGLSHFVIDEDLDQRVLKAMVNHDDEALAALPRERLNSGTSEIRNWLVVAGAAHDLDTKVIDYVPCYRSPAATGCAMAFAHWS